VAAGTALLLDGSGSSDAEAPLAGYRWNYGEEIVLRAADVPSTNIHGRWARVSAGAAAGGIALQNTNQGDAKKTKALAEPTDYFDITFEAASGVPYYVWLRMRASRNSYSNDSVFVQFSGALNSSGSPVYRIGTTSGMGIVLEEGYGAGVAGWGWNDNGYGTLGIPVYFASSGPQTLRIQQREDGVTLDQLVISASAFAGKSPGEYKSDTTILPLNFGTESGITALHTYAHRGTYPVRLTVTDSKGQSGSDAAKASVR
jgi:hypothetical protein